MTRLARPRGEPLTVLDAGEYLSDEVVRTGDYFEAAVLDDLLPLVRPGLAIDAGAFIGNHALFLARHAPVTVHAFEPNPLILPVLRTNAARVANVVVHPLALWERAARLPMRHTVAQPGHAGVSVSGPLRFRTDAIALDSLRLDGVSVIKLDVERSEPAVLRGAWRTIQRCQPVIVIEDWDQTYHRLLPGYRLAADHGERHQTYVYVPA